MAMNAAKALGWFSVGLGAAQLLAPQRLNRAAGTSLRPAAMRTLGVRELATGAGILAAKRTTPGLWARVAGDAMDMALLTKAYRNGHSGRTACAAGLVLAVGAADAICAYRSR